MVGCECEHNWVEIERITYCSESGKIIYECSKCKEKKEESIAPTGGTHDLAKTEEKPISLYDKSYELYKCSKCDYIEYRNERNSLQEEAKIGFKAVLNELKSSLKDPDSFVMDDFAFCKIYQYKDYEIYYIDYGFYYRAKNSFGGYVKDSYNKAWAVITTGSNYTTRGLYSTVTFSEWSDYTLVATLSLSQIQ